MNTAVRGVAGVATAVLSKTAIATSVTPLSQTAAAGRSKTEVLAWSSVIAAAPVAMLTIATVAGR